MIKGYKTVESIVSWAICITWLKFIHSNIRLTWDYLSTLKITKNIGITECIPKHNFTFLNLLSIHREVYPQMNRPYIINYHIHLRLCLLALFFRISLSIIYCYPYDFFFGYGGPYWWYFCCFIEGAYGFCMLEYCMCFKISLIWSGFLTSLRLCKF